MEWKYSSTFLDLGITFHTLCRLLAEKELSVAIGWEDGWAPRACLDAVEKRKIKHFGQSNPDRPSPRLSLYRLSYPSILFIESSN
jgi:hypothetical protein